jgi:Putative Actinobacterial Holin-X, holin superfamily III
MSQPYDPGQVAPEPADREEALREAPLGEVLAQTAQDASDLFRQEVALAKAEVKEKGQQLGAGAGMLAGAAVVGLAALGAFTAWLILLIGGWLDSYTWGAIIVTLLWAVVAGILAMVGKSRIQKAAPPAPTETADSVKEDVQWVKTQTQSARR